VGALHFLRRGYSEPKRPKAHVVDRLFAFLVQRMRFVGFGKCLLRSSLSSALTSSKDGPLVALPQRPSYQSLSCAVTLLFKQEEARHSIS
jgi:hypothetical protein